MTQEQISKLETIGFKRWTKGEYDRLYINASALGLECEYYKTGNVSSAEFRGKWISNCEAKRMKAAKTFINIKDGKVHSDNATLKEAVQFIIDTL